MRKLLAIAFAGMLAFGMAGCSSASTLTSSSSSSAAATSEAAEASDDATIVATEIDESLYDLEYTNRDQDPSYDESAATRIDLASGAGEITSEGVYVLSGALADGQVVVNAPEDAKVQLVLDGADITNPKGAAIYVQQADKCFITLADGSSNRVSDGADYTFEDGADEPDAAIFSKCDLTLQGSGSLTVEGAYNDAVKTKDDLVITGGTYDVNAKGDGLVGRDSVKIADGDIAVKTTEGDGVKSSKDTKEGKGFVSIDGGTISVDAANKGVKAETYLRVTGGEVDVTAGDDALHCDGCGRIAGGDVTISAGDDGFHVDYVLEVNGGTIDIQKSYEGLEGQTITLNDGDVSIVASDDGINAASAGDGSDEFGAVTGGDGTSHWMDFNRMPDGEAPEPPSEGSAPSGGAPSDMREQQGSSSSASGEADARSQGGRMGGGFGGRGQGGQDGGFGGGGMMDADESCTLTINGGTLVVDAAGDGLDSNGAIVMNGGTVYVNGPTSSGDGALDCGTTITANGGTLIAVGSSGMAEGFTDGTQPFAQVNVNGSAGTELQVVDASGSVLASFTPTKAYQNVVLTAPGLVEGSTYDLVAGSSSAEFTASTTASESAGFGGGFGGMGGMGGRGGASAA